MSTGYGGLSDILNTTRTVGEPRFGTNSLARPEWRIPEAHTPIPPPSQYVTPIVLRGSIGDGNCLPSDDMSTPLSIKENSQLDTFLFDFIWSETRYNFLYKARWKFQYHAINFSSDKAYDITSYEVFLDIRYNIDKHDLSLIFFYKNITLSIAVLWQFRDHIQVNYIESYSGM